MKPSDRLAAWRDKLPRQARDAIDEKIAALETDKRIAHGHRHADYAKRTLALKLAKEAGLSVPKPEGARRPQR
jgi:hypothetical protein